MSGLEVDANSEVIEELHSPHHARVHYGMSGLEVDLNSGGKDLGSSNGEFSGQDPLRNSPRGGSGQRRERYMSDPLRNTREVAVGSVAKGHVRPTA